MINISIWFCLHLDLENAIASILFIALGPSAKFDFNEWNL